MNYDQGLGECRKNGTALSAHTPRASRCGVTAAIAFAALALCLTSCEPERVPKVGEIWITKYADAQPFFRNPIEREITAVCGGYVKYEYAGMHCSVCGSVSSIEDFQDQFNFVRPDTSLTPCQ